MASFSTSPTTAGWERKPEGIGRVVDRAATGGESKMSGSVQDSERARVIAAVDEALVLDLAKRVIEIPSATGEEENFARFLVVTMREAGFRAKLRKSTPGASTP